MYIAVFSSVRIYMYMYVYFVDLLTDEMLTYTGFSSVHIYMYVFFVDLITDEFTEGGVRETILSYSLLIPS